MSTSASKSGRHIKTTMVLKEVKTLMKRGISRRDFPGYLQGRGYTNPQGKPYSVTTINTFVYLLKHGERGAAGQTRRGRPRTPLMELKSGTTTPTPKTGVQLRAALKLIQKVTAGDLVTPQDQLEAIQEVLNVLR